MRRREHGNGFVSGHAGASSCGAGRTAFPRSCGACEIFRILPRTRTCRSGTALRRRSRGGIRRTALRDGVVALDSTAGLLGSYERGPMHRPIDGIVSLNHSVWLRAFTIEAMRR